MSYYKGSSFPSSRSSGRIGLFTGSYQPGPGISPSGCADSGAFRTADYLSVGFSGSTCSGDDLPFASSLRFSIIDKARAGALRGSR